jgi:hypothetical protein
VKVKSQKPGFPSFLCSIGEKFQKVNSNNQIPNSEFGIWSSPLFGICGFGI